MANSIPGLGTERRPKNPDGELFQFGARCPVLLQTRHPRPVLVNRGKNRFSGRSIVKWLCEMTSAQGSGPRICQRIVGGHSLPGCGPVGFVNRGRDWGRPTASSPRSEVWLRSNRAAQAAGTWAMSPITLHPMRHPSTPWPWLSGGMRKPAKMISMPLPPMTSPGLHARQQHRIGEAGQSEARK